MPLSATSRICGLIAPSQSAAGGSTVSIGSAMCASWRRTRVAASPKLPWRIAAPRSAAIVGGAVASGLGQRIADLRQQDDLGAWRRRDGWSGSLPLFHAVHRLDNEEQNEGDDEKLD